MTAVLGYGGHRVRPEHYEPDRVPPELARLSGTPDTLAPGSPGKVGVLDLGFAHTGSRTELVRHYQKAPLQIMRPLYYDPWRPDLPITYLMSTGAGIMQGDRLRTDLGFGPGSSGHLTTSAYTKALRMEHDYAVAQVNLWVEDGAYVEYLPDPLIAFAGARLFQRIRVTLAESATLIIGDTLIAGRLAGGERHRYTVLALDLEVSRPDGLPVLVDRMRLDPAAAQGPAVLDGRGLVATLTVLTPDVPAEEVADLLRAALAPLAGAELATGVSVLPGDTGAWLRVVGDDPVLVARARTLAWQAARLRLTGRPAPTIRKS